MTRIDALLARYRRHLALPPRASLPLSQRIWFLVYPPGDERRLSVRLPEFEIATREAGLNWRRVDLGGAYADWMDGFDPEERDCCLDDPVLVEEYADPGLRDFLCQRVRAAVAGAAPDRAERTVFAVTGLMELYDFIQVSAVIDALDRSFPGILLVFFPGEREGNTYRFLNARTGWDYLAVPILAEE